MCILLNNENYFHRSFFNVNIYRLFCATKIVNSRRSFDYTAETQSPKQTINQCGLAMPYGDIEIGEHSSENGVLPGRTKSVPQPVLAYCQLDTSKWGTIFNEV